jgi:cyanophycinase
MHAFLIGGGRDERGVAASHAPFVQAARRHGPAPVVALVLDEGAGTDVERWRGNLAAAGAGEVRTVVVSEDSPPRVADVEGAAGVYVAGGLTPGYQEALVARGTAWLEPLRERGVPFAGFSAGAAIAPRRALVGGWRADVRGARVAICDPDAGEDLEALTVRAGLGLVDFVVDVHASQWGTLGRLLHGVVAAGAPAGLAIDEATTVEVRDGTLTVHGHGAAYRARRRPDGLTVDVLVAGDTARLDA